MSSDNSAGTPGITQAMIDAYDEYTHLTLDRRGFMQKLTRLAGSGAAAAAIAPMLAAKKPRRRWFIQKREVCVHASR